jgi:ATP-binding cassette subfamily C (CFTR/MRP) protein 1
MVVCSRVSRYVALNLKEKQKAWNLATQERIAAISIMLASMKSVKALGLSDAIAAQIQGLREYELARADELRWIMVIYNSSGEEHLTCL